MKQFALISVVFFILLSIPQPVIGDSRGLSESSSVATPFVNGVYRALIIGNNEYNDPDGLWASLKTPISDAEAIAKTLRTAYGFSPENITMLKNATRAKILAAFSDMAKVSKENDSVFIYYAGHGYSDPDTKEAFWIPVDARGKEDYTYVRNSTIKSKLAILADQVKHVLLVSDSCFSGAILREGHRGIRHEDKNEQYYKKVARKKSVQILAAGGLEFVDDDYKGTGHSPFTYYFLKQLELNDDPYYSATELSLEVTKAVSKNVHQTPEKGILHGAGDNNGEFFFLATRTQKSDGSLQEKAAKSSPTSGSLNAEEEMWALVKDSTEIDDIKSFLAAYPNGHLAPAAKLKLQQLERNDQRGGQTGTASIKTPLAEHPQKDLKTDSGPKLAILPWCFRNNGEKASMKAVKALGDLLNASDQFGEIQSYYQFKDNQRFSDIEFSIDKDKLWSDTGFFSTPKPNLEAIADYGRRLGVNAVFMYFLNVRKGSISQITAYLIDVEKQRSYSAEDSCENWRAEGYQVAKTVTVKVLRDYGKKP